MLNSTCLHNAQPCKEGKKVKKKPLIDNFNNFNFKNFYAHIKIKTDGRPCQHLCKPTSKGHQCACRHGYQLADDLRSCLDIDECNVSSKLHCSQMCENTVPGFICICSSGFELVSDGHHCRSIDKQPMRLLYANRVDINWLIPPDQLNNYQTYIDDYKQLQRISTTTSSPSINNNDKQQIQFINHKKMHLLPLTEQQQNQISEMWLLPLLQFNFSISADLQQQAQQQQANTVNSQILLNNLQNAVSIDFHWITGRLYWADITDDAIYMMHINGTAIDGTNVIKPIVQAGLVSPSGLCVDWINGFVIWCDSGTSRIELCDLDGDNRHVLLHRDIRRPRDIVVFPEKSIIFWTDWGNLK